MSTLVREGFKILEHFTLLAFSPGESKTLALLVEESREHKCPYFTVLPQPANRNSPKGFYVLFGSPYPVDNREATELLAEWQIASAKARENK